MDSACQQIDTAPVRPSPQNQIKHQCTPFFTSLQITFRTRHFRLQCNMKVTTAVSKYHFFGLAKAGFFSSKKAFIMFAFGLEVYRGQHIGFSLIRVGERKQIYLLSSSSVSLKGKPGGQQHTQKNEPLKRLPRGRRRKQLNPVEQIIVVLLLLFAAALLKSVFWRAL